MNDVIRYYENYDEEGRLIRSKARQIEFITTIHILDGIIPNEAEILEVGAGTGRYSFYYAAKGHHVTATDIVPKHVHQMENKLEQCDDVKDMNIALADGCDLSQYSNESFDTVLCLGPLYHLTDSRDRNQCIKECLRVLKTNGHLAIAYINKFFVFTHMVKSNREYCNEDFMKKILDNGFIDMNDKDCFWTDGCYYTPDEMEKLMHEFKVEKITNVGVDGISVLLQEMVENMDEQEYKNWLEYHLRTCAEPSILGYSNHGLYVCQKR